VLVNKSDLIERVADGAEVGRQQAERVLDAFFETVKGAAKKGDRVAWPGFGSFSVSARKARTGRNPRTGEAVKIRASKALKFSSGSALKEYLNGGAATKSAGAKKASGAKKAPARATAGKKATKATKAAKAKKR
jgi:DNA-binding protein HU-beta